MNGTADLLLPRIGYRSANLPLQRLLQRPLRRHSFAITVIRITKKREGAHVAGRTAAGAASISAQASMQSFSLSRPCASLFPIAVDGTACSLPKAAISPESSRDSGKRPRPDLAIRKAGPISAFSLSRSPPSASVPQSGETREGGDSSNVQLSAAEERKKNWAQIEERTMDGEKKKKARRDAFSLSALSILLSQQQASNEQCTGG